MVSVFFILINGWGFDSYSECETALKLVTSSYPFNWFTECRVLITWFAPVNILRNKNNLKCFFKWK